jgi:hypothetical protein
VRRRHDHEQRGHWKKQSAEQVNPEYSTNCP